jgi:hypothetical protein
LKSEANLHQHWRHRHRRQKGQEWAIKAAWRAQNNPRVSLPCLVRLTRYSGRKMDDDNLIFAFKKIRDVIADLILPGYKPGHADGKGQMRFEYDQKKGSPAFITIEIFHDHKKNFE